MTQRHQQHILHGVSAAVLLAAAGVLLAGWKTPVWVGSSRMASRTPVAATQKDVPRAVELPELQALCRRDLRPSLTDKPAAVAAATFAVQLVGTVNEPGHSVAILKKADGTTAICGVGEAVTDGTVVAVVRGIDADRVRMEVAGAMQELHMPRAPGTEGTP